MTPYAKLNIEAAVAFIIQFIAIYVIYFIISGLGGGTKEFFVVAGLMLVVDVVSSYGIDCRKKARLIKIEQEVNAILAFAKLEGKQ